MKKKIIIICVLTLLLTVSICTQLNKTKTFIKDGVIFAVTLDGKDQTSFPDYSTGKYKVKINCKNAKGFYKPVKQSDGTYKMQFTLEKINGKVSCTLDFNTINEDDYLNNNIKNYNSNNNNGYRFVFVGNGNGYKSNHVLFNDELWRIVGVFETKLANGETKLLTKIMYIDTIGVSDLKGNWPDSNLYKLLNGPYLNKVDGTDSGYCIGTSSSFNRVCNYEDNGIGLDSYYGKMLENVVWYLGGMSTSSADDNYYSNALPEKWYIEERNNNVYDGNSVTTTGYVGLPYVSDYGLTTCTGYATNRWNTYGKYSWQYDMLDSWFINPVSNNANNHYYLTNEGGIASTSGSLKYVKPVVYLSEDVYIVHGTGNVGDPYILAM